MNFEFVCIEYLTKPQCSFLYTLFHACRRNIEKNRQDISTEEQRKERDVG